MAESNVTQADALRVVQVMDTLTVKAQQLQAVTSCMAAGGNIEAFKLNLSDDEKRDLHWLVYDLACEVSQLARDEQLHELVSSSARLRGAT